MSLIKEISRDDNKSNSYYARLLIKDHLKLITENSTKVIVSGDVARRNNYNHRGLAKELDVHRKWLNVFLLINNLSLEDRIMENMTVLVPNGQQLAELMSRLRT